MSARADVGESEIKQSIGVFGDLLGEVFTRGFPGVAAATFGPGAVPRPIFDEMRGMFVDAQIDTVVAHFLMATDLWAAARPDMVAE